MPKGKKAIVPREPPVRMLIKIDEYNNLYERVHSAERQVAEAKNKQLCDLAAHQSTNRERQAFHDLAKQTQDQFDGYRRGVEETLRVIYGKLPVIIERR